MNPLTPLPTNDEIAPLLAKYPAPLGRSWDEHATMLRIAKAHADELRDDWERKRLWWGWFELGGWIGGLMVLYQWLN